MDLKTLEKINIWKNANIDAKLREELNSLTEEELEDAFYTDIAFGTGGLRGVMGVGTNRMNVHIINKCTYGFGQYLLEKAKGCNNPFAIFPYSRACSGNSLQNPGLRSAF